MAKNTFRTSPPEEQNTIKAESFLSRLKNFGNSEERHPFAQILIKYILKFFMYFFSITIVWVFVLKFLPIWFTPTMIDRKITAISEGRDSEIHSD